MTHNVGRRDSPLRIPAGFVLAPPSVRITAPAWIHVALGASPAVPPGKVYRKAT